MPDSKEPERKESERKEIVGPVAGVSLIALSLSGFLDDTGSLRHPWWVVLLGLAAVVGLLLGARTVRKLVNLGS